MLGLGCPLVWFLVIRFSQNQDKNLLVWTVFSVTMSVWASFLWVLRDPCSILFRQSGSFLELHFWETHVRALGLDMNEAYTAVTLNLGHSPRQKVSIKVSY